MDDVDALLGEMEDAAVGVSADEVRLVARLPAGGGDGSGRSDGKVSRNERKEGDVRGSWRALDGSAEWWPDVDDRAIGVVRRSDGEAVPVVDTEPRSSDDEQHALLLVKKFKAGSGSGLGGGLWAPGVEPPSDAVGMWNAIRKHKAVQSGAFVGREVERSRALRRLAQTFTKGLKSAKLDVHISTLERWIIGVAEEAWESVADDGSLPPYGKLCPLLNVAPESGQSHKLIVAELTAAGSTSLMSEKLLSKMVQICRKSAARVQELSPSIGTVTKRRHGRLVTVSAMGVEMSINQDHWVKLEEMHSGHRLAVEEDIFCLLLRYQGLAGGSSDRGGGMQGAVHGTVFDFLQRRLGCSFECFASPLNVRFRRFCSAFEDTDRVFGSLGSFFSFFPRAGVYEANPPFVPVVMERMVRHMEVLLCRADENGLPLTFVVIVPTCVAGRDQKPAQAHARRSFLMLEECGWLSRHTVLDAKAHGYVEGRQHLLPTRYKTSKFATSVFVLQSLEGSKVSSLGDDWDEGIRAASGSLHEAETLRRRHSVDEDEMSPTFGGTRRKHDGSHTPTAKRKRK